MAARVELGEPLGELGDPFAAGVLGHRSLLEGVEVAVERLVDLALLGGKSLELRFSLGPVGVELREGALDRLADERFLLERADELLMTACSSWSAGRLSASQAARP